MKHCSLNKRIHIWLLPMLLLLGLQQMASAQCTAPVFLSGPPATDSMTNLSGKCYRIISRGFTFSGTAPKTYTITYSGAQKDSFTTTTATLLDTFVVGTTNVTITASNACGTATHSFKVIVTDIEAPILNGPDSISLLAGNECDVDRNSINSYYYVQDNCGPGSRVNDAPSRIPIGTTNVTFTFADKNGNTATRTVQVNVLAGVIDVTGNNLSIADGDDTPATADGTLISTPIYDTVQRTFVVKNIGTYTLFLDNISLKNQTGGGGFSIVNSSTKNLQPGKSSIITVQFSATTAGTKTAELEILNSTCHKATFNFKLQANVTCTAPAFVSGPPATISLSNQNGQCYRIVSQGYSFSGTAPLTYTIKYSGAQTDSFTTTSTTLLDTFAVGTTNVTITVSNACGTASKSFQVVITDAEAPTINGKDTASYDVPCKLPKSSLTQSGSSNSYSAKDNCGISSFSNDAPSNLTPGTHTVTFSATDIHGNTSTRTVAITVNVPEIDVTGNGLAIADGDNTPSAADGTLFTTTPGVTVKKTFAIKNTGTARLYIDDIVLSDNSIFHILNGPDYVDAGQSKNVVVQFSATTAGTRTTELNIWSTDCDEGLYNFKLQADVICDSPVFVSGPPATISLNNQNGKCYRIVSQGYNFSGTAPLTYTIKYSGAQTDSFTTTSTTLLDTFAVGTTNVTITASNACGSATKSFQVVITDTQSPTIAGPASIDSTITSGCGISNSVLSAYYVITDNCGIDTVYNDAPSLIPIGTTNVTLTAVGIHGDTTTKAVPVTVHAGQIVITGNNITINNHDGIPSQNDGTYFGSPYVGGSITKTYEVKNTGDADLVVNSVNLTYNTDNTFSINSNPFPATIAPGQSKSFSIKGKASSSGYKSAYVGVSNGDCNNGPYSFSIGLDATCPGFYTINVPSSFSVAAPYGQCDTTIQYSVYASSAGSNTGNTFKSELSGATVGTIDNGSNNNFTQTFNIGVTTVKITVTNYCGKSQSQTFTVTVRAGEIGVTGNNISIADGNTSVSISDDTYFGLVYVNQSITHTFNVKNTGGADLVVNNLSLANNTQNTFSIVSNPFPATISPGQSKSFSVKGLPTSRNTKYADVVIENGDCDEDTFTFRIGVESVCPPIDLYHSMPPGYTVSAAPGKCDTTLTFEAVAYSGTNYVYNFTYEFSGATTYFISSHSNSLTYPFNVGVTTVKITSTNYCGNTATKTFTVTVQDNQAPTITAPANTTANNNSGSCFATNVVLGTPTTSDNCGIDSVWNNAPASYPVGTTAVLWTVKDVNGNTDTATQFVTVTDNQLPAIAAPADVTVNIDNGSCTATNVTLGTPVVTDNCGVDSVWNNAPSSYPIGTTTVTWTAIDIHGNSKTAIQKVTVVDNINPTITAPATAFANIDTINYCSVANIVLGTPITADNCTVDTVWNDAPYTFPVGSTFVTWTVRDASGNTATATQQVVVRWPDIYVDGANKPIVNNDSTPAGGNNTLFGDYLVGGLTYTKNYRIWNQGISSLRVFSIEIIDDSGSNFTLLPTTQPFTLTQGNLKNISVSFTSNQLGTHTAKLRIRSNDCTDSTYVFLMKGVVTCIPAQFTSVPSNITATADSGMCSTVVNYNIPVSGSPAATVSYTFSGATTAGGSGTGSGSTFNAGTTTVIVNAQNHCNTIADTFTVTVTDNQNPVITVPSAVTVNVDSGACAATNVTLGTPITSDNCGVDSVWNNAPSSFAVGTTTVTWTVTDIHGNTSTDTQTVTVIDNQNPAITVANVSLSIDTNYCYVSKQKLPTPTITDNCGIDSIWNNAPVLLPIGNTSVTWTAKDIHGNTATATHNVLVKAPEINVNGDGIMGTELCIGQQVSRNFKINNTGNANLKISKIEIIDDTNGNFLFSRAEKNVPFQWQPISVPFSMSSSDDVRMVIKFKGTQVGTATATVKLTTNDCDETVYLFPLSATVMDSTQFVSCQSAITSIADSGLCGAAVTYTTTASNADSYTYSFSGATTGNGTGTGSGSLLNVGTTNVRIVAHSSCSKTTDTCNFTVTVNDTQNPTITCSDITVNADNGLCAATNVNLGIPNTSDNCGIASTTNNAPSSFPVGKTTVTWTVTDIHGNTNTTTQNVTVKDKEKPTITLPQVLTFHADSNGCLSSDTLALMRNTPTVTDNCGVQAIIMFTGSTLSPTAQDFNGGNNTVIWDASDIHQNYREAIKTVYIVAPEIDISGNGYSLADGMPAHTLFKTDFGSNLVANQVYQNEYRIKNTGGDTLNVSNIEITDDADSSFSIIGNTSFMIPPNTDTGITVAFTGSQFKTYTAKVKVTSNDCNEGVSTFNLKAKVICTTPQFVTSQSNIVRSAAKGLCSDTVTYTTSLLGVGDYTYRFTGATTATDTGSGSGSVFNAGVTNVQVFVTNSCGADTCSFTVTVNDTEKPVIIAPTTVTTYADKENCLATYVNLGIPVVSDNCGVDSFWSDKSTHFPVGTTTVTWTVKDIHGNTNTATQDVIVIDNQNPTIVCPVDVTVNADNGNCSAANVALGTPTTSDNCGVDSVWNNAPSSFPVGTTTVTWTVTDIHGNSSIDTQTVTVTDNQNPTITVPVAITVNADSGSCTATNVTLGTPTASDNCGVDSVWNDAPSLYPVGTTTITWTVTDIHGNSNTATQTVTVVDNQNPTITAPAAVTVNADNGNCSAANVALGTPTTSDNCGIDSIWNNAPISYPVGTTTVTWTVTDIHNNSTTATQTVTVIDNQNPTITAPAAVTVNADNGNCSAANVALGTPTTSDNCGIDSIWNNAPISYPVGTTTVTWTVTDIHGNSSTATQTVTVVDNQNPVVATQNQTIYLDASGSVSITVGDINNGSTDNCGIDSMSLDKTTFSCSDVGSNTVTLTVTDIHGNSATGTAIVTVTDTMKPVITCPASITASCQTTPATTGMATATDACGIDTITYTDASTYSNNPADAAHYNYTITRTWTATDVNDNSNTCTQIINVQQLKLTASVSNALCNGDNSGSIDLTVTGGVGNLNYNWNNSATTEDISGLTAGTYSVTVIDSAGCSATATYTVTEPTMLALTAINVSPNPAISGQAMNTIYLGYGPQSVTLSSTATGGTPGYTYSWAPAATVANPAAASTSVSPTTTTTYTLTVTDSNSCSSSVQKTIYVKDVQYGNNKVIICHKGHTKHVSVNAVQAHLNHGDQLGECFELSAQENEVACYGGSDGSIDVTVHGGIPPFSYSWNTGDTTEDLSGLAAGNYTLTVTAANNEVTSETFKVKQYTRIDIKGYVYDVDCYGSNDGKIYLGVNGGKPSYSYLWSDNNTAQNRYNLAAGTYSVSVTDKKGCTASDTFTVTQPSTALSVTGNVTDPSCNEEYGGTIDLTVSGGTAPYTYYWTKGNQYWNWSWYWWWFGKCSQQDLSGINAGTYTVIVKDKNGCIISKTFTVAPANKPNVTVSVSPNPTVNGQAQYTIYKGYGPQSVTLSASVTGGTTPYTYSWAPTSSLSGSNNANVTASPSSTTNYQLKVTDAEGCSENANRKIYVEDVESYGEKIRLCHDGKNKTVPYSAVAAHLAHGDLLGYCKAQCKGCTTPDNDNKDEGIEKKGQETSGVAGVLNNDITHNNTLKVYPNPNQGTFTVDLPENVKGGEAILSDMTGKVIKRIRFMPNAKLIFNMPAITDGMYMLEVKNGKEVYRARVMVKR